MVLTLPSMGTVDKDGFSGRVALPICALTHSLLLPFCCSFRDVLDFLLLAFAQLHSHACRVFLCSFVVFRMVLEHLGQMYLDLTARELLSFYFVKGLPSNICSFRIRSKHLVALESCHSNAKQWQRKFLLISSGGWEFPAS